MTPEDTALTRAFMGHAETVAERLVSLHGLLLAGVLTPADFIEMAALLVGAAMARMFAFGDAALAAWLTTETGVAVPALGLVSPDETGRLADGLSTLLARVDPESPEARVARFGRAEVAGAFQDGYSAAMRERPEVGGYVRVLNVDACELCYWLWRDGFVWPSSKSFHRHPGCGCHPGPVLRGDP